MAFFLPGFSGLKLKRLPFNEFENPDYKHLLVYAHIINIGRYFSDNKRYTKSDCDTIILKKQDLNCEMFIPYREMLKCLSKIYCQP
jgi:hypothetical protein